MGEDEEFCAAVWEALKGDHNDLRRQQIILAAHRASLANTRAASGVGADALAHLESEARRFAGFYEPNSDMANTLNILGNKIAALAPEGDAR